MQGPESPNVSSAGPAASPGRTRPDRSIDGDAVGGEVETLRPITLLAAAVGILAALCVGIAYGATASVALATFSAVGMAVAVQALQSEDPVRLAGGTVLALVSVFGVAGGALTGPYLLVLSLALAGFGSAAVPAGAVGDGRFVDAMGTLLFALIPAGVVAILAILLRSVGPVLGEVAGGLGSGGVGQDLFTAAILFVAAGVALLWAIRTLPIVRLAHKRDRDRVRSQVIAVERALRRATLAAVVSVLGASFLWAAMGSDVESLQPVAEPIAAVLGSPPVQFPLLGLAGLGVVVAVSTVLVREAGGTLVEVTRRGVAIAVGAGVTLLAVLLHGPVYSTARRELPPDLAEVAFEVSSTVGQLATVLTGGVFVVVAVAMAGLVLPAAVGVGITPDRAAGAAFGAAGLFGGAILASGSVPGPVVFGSVVAGLVVWDLGEFGVGIAEEVGVDSASRGEGVHAATTLFVGFVATTGASLAHVLVTDVSFEGAPALAAVAVIFVGIVLLIAVVRG